MESGICRIPGNFSGSGVRRNPHAKVRARLTRCASTGGDRGLSPGPWCQSLTDDRGSEMARHQAELFYEQTLLLQLGEQRSRPSRGLFDHSTVTDFARLRGLSTSVPRAQAVW
jgi:hypothetical protein